MLAVLGKDERHAYGETTVDVMEQVGIRRSGTAGFTNQFSKRRIRMIIRDKKTSVLCAIVVVVLVSLAGCGRLPAAKDPSPGTAAVPPGQSVSSDNSPFPSSSSSAAVQSDGKPKTAPASEPTTQEPSMAEMIKDAENYPSTFPKFDVSCEDTSIPWIRGDANYTGRSGAKVGNTSFGADEIIAGQALKAANVKAGSIIKLKAAEVTGLDKPQYKVYLFDKAKTSSQLMSSQNQMAAPKEAGEYLFYCDVNWGKGDNEIVYWFKINVS